MAVAVVASGDHFEYYTGYRDRLLPVDENTVFQLASVSKPITTTILATLGAAGKLVWNAQVPGTWQGSPAPTYAELLSHRAGFADHAGD